MRSPQLLPLCTELYCRINRLTEPARPRHQQQQRCLLPRCTVLTRRGADQGRGRVGGQSPGTVRLPLGLSCSYQAAPWLRLYNITFNLLLGGCDGYKQLEFRLTRHQAGPAHALHRGRDHQHLPGAALHCDAVLHCAGQVVCSQLEHSVMAVFTTGRSPETELVADILNTFQVNKNL